MAKVSRLMPDGLCALEWRSSTEVRAMDYVDAWCNTLEKRIQLLEDLHEAIVRAGGNSPFEGINFVPQE